VVYEKSYGKIPKDWLVVHIDDNKTNNIPNNLVAMPKKIYGAIRKQKLVASKELVLKLIKNYNTVKNCTQKTVVINVTSDEAVKVVEPLDRFLLINRSGSSLYR
jgi:hypothetical protein